MTWLKRGLIYSPQGQYSWNKTHASVPVVDMIDDRVWRIYFATRDDQNRSHISFVEVEAGNPGNVLYEHPEPILPLGELGTFDDCGLMPSWIVNNGVEKYLYYLGSTIRHTVPYQNSVGLAVSKDGGRSFERFSAGPLFGPTYREPYFSGTSCVLIEDGIWKNWYLSCTKWAIFGGKPEPFYHLKYAESPDGVNWRREGVVAIDFKTESEGGIAKASVVREDVYKMWYAHRSANDYRTNRENSYRIGYAESPDGICWTRRDDLVGIDVSNEGWDSEMIEYPHVIKANGQKYLFYNGNGFGRSGFGYATSVDARVP